MLGYFASPREKHNYRMALLAILGIAYFSIWRFAEYYMDLFHPHSGLKNIVFASLILGAVILGLLPWITAIKRTPALLLVALFGVCAVLTFSLEKNIKNNLAEWGGYFDHATVSFKKVIDEAHTRRYHNEAGAYSIRIPLHWRKIMHSSGLYYLQWQQDESLQAELRPRCFHKAELSVSEIMDNIFQWDRGQGYQVEGRCFIPSDGGYVCFIQSKKNGEINPRERWRWMVMDDHQHRNIELDILFYNDKVKARHEAGAIINSLTLMPTTGPLHPCISPMDWM
jgi:hypothetical protein